MAFCKSALHRSDSQVLSEPLGLTLSQHPLEKAGCWGRVVNLLLGPTQAIARYRAQETQPLTISMEPPPLNLSYTWLMADHLGN